MKNTNHLSVYRIYLDLYERIVKMTGDYYILLTKSELVKLNF